MLNDLDDILESDKPITIEHYKKLIDMKVLDDPLLFLDAIVKGKDPRAISELSAKVLEIDITMLDQNSINIIEDLKDSLKYKPVPIKESIAAAKTITEYLHAKKKSVEMTADIKVDDVEVQPLTTDEIKDFRDIFNAEF